MSLQLCWYLAIATALVILPAPVLPAPVLPVAVLLVVVAVLGLPVLILPVSVRAILDLQRRLGLRWPQGFRTG